MHRIKGKQQAERHARTSVPANKHPENMLQNIVVSGSLQLGTKLLVVVPQSSSTAKTKEKPREQQRIIETDSIINEFKSDPRQQKYTETAAIMSEQYKAADSILLSMC